MSEFKTASSRKRTADDAQLEASEQAEKKAKAEARPKLKTYPGTAHPPVMYISKELKRAVLVCDTCRGVYDFGGETDVEEHHIGPDDYYTCNDCAAVQTTSTATATIATAAALAPAPVPVPSSDEFPIHQQYNGNLAVFAWNERHPIEMKQSAKCAVKSPFCEKKADNIFFLAPKQNLVKLASWATFPENKNTPKPATTGQVRMCPCCFFYINNCPADFDPKTYDVKKVQPAGSFTARAEACSSKDVLETLVQIINADKNVATQVSCYMGHVHPDKPYDVYRLHSAKLASRGKMLKSIVYGVNRTTHWVVQDLPDAAEA